MRRTSITHLQKRIYTLGKILHVVLGPAVIQTQDAVQQRKPEKRLQTQLKVLTWFSLPEVWEAVLALAPLQWSRRLLVKVAHSRLAWSQNRSYLKDRNACA